MGAGPKASRTWSSFLWTRGTINDLPLCTTLLALLFADDTTLLASCSNLPELINYVNDELYKISTYFRNNKLALHPQKTQFMLISNSPTAKNAPVNLFIKNNNSLESPDQNLVHPISRVLSSSATPAVKFLGVYFDTELNFKYPLVGPDEIDDVYALCSQYWPLITISLKNSPWPITESLSYAY